MFFQGHRKISPAPKPNSPPVTQTPKTGRIEIEQQIERVSDLVKQKPDKAARILADWISRKSGKKGSAA
jgi:flagellar biosynthesis/type III secretory pathway M-ring protein FliF/YscJ